MSAGCAWGEVDKATHEFGLATPSGIIASTGVSGLALGGGHGYLTRKYGLTVLSHSSKRGGYAQNSFGFATPRGIM